MKDFNTVFKTCNQVLLKISTLAPKAIFLYLIWWKTCSSHDLMEFSFNLIAVWWKDWRLSSHTHTPTHPSSSFIKLKFDDIFGKGLEMPLRHNLSHWKWWDWWKILRNNNYWLCTIRNTETTIKIKVIKRNLIHISVMICFHIYSSMIVRKHNHFYSLLT